MRDPLPVPPSLYTFSKPYASSLHLHTLPLHIHEVLLSFLFFILTEQLISPYLSRRLLPRYYPNFDARTKINWNIHVTSFVNSLILGTGAIFTLLLDPDLDASSWQSRIWGYTPLGGALQAIATGYFIWDLLVCIIHVKLMGSLYLLHGLGAIVISFLGFRPFALYYGLGFLLFELSTPFVNLHWIFDKVNMTGSNAQWYNGVVLIGSFGCARLLWGPYLTYYFFKDLFTALNEKGLVSTQIKSVLGDEQAVRLTHELPGWMAVVFIAVNLGFTTLNFWWFSRMIETVRKRFRPTDEKKKAI